MVCGGERKKRERKGGGRLRMPEGGDRSCVVVEEKNIKAADECLRNRFNFH
jgi:hypothetical protein